MRMLIRSRVEKPVSSASVSSPLYYTWMYFSFYCPNALSDTGIIIPRKTLYHLSGSRELTTFNSISILFKIHRKQKCVSCKEWAIIIIPSSPKSPQRWWFKFWRFKSTFCFKQSATSQYETLVSRKTPAPAVSTKVVLFSSQVLQCQHDDQVLLYPLPPPGDNGHHQPALVAKTCHACLWKKTAGTRGNWWMNVLMHDFQEARGRGGGGSPEGGQISFGILDSSEVRQLW